ncbi:MAG: hypothetical protein ACTSPV_05910 [Candidatus Hodarchaeales archaeon]
MDKSLVKKAFDEASKDIEKEKREKIKKIILETLRKRENLKEKVKRLQEKIKILTKDLEDFKQGRLDLIEERQKVDKLARETSVVKIEAIIHEGDHYEKPWWKPYSVVYPSDWSTTYSTENLVFDVSSDTLGFTAAGTDFHYNFSGSYNINGLIINL